MMIAADLAKALGGRWHGSYGTACCPGHDDRRPSLTISDGNDGKLLVRCHAGCDQRRVVFALRKLGLWPGRPDEILEPTEADKARDRKQRTERERDRERRAAFVARTWREAWEGALAARSSPVERWLSARSIPLEPAELDRMPLRWASRCLRGDSAAPAMLALMTDAMTADPCGIHRTFLTADGSAKAFGKDSRMMLGRAGIIRLSPDDEVQQGLGICEVIETGLAIIAAGWRPVWACGSLEALKRFPVLADVECLTVFADPKPQEIAGARACADRWAQAGREAIVRIPSIGDWNDALVAA